MSDETTHPAATRLVNALLYGLTAEGLKEANKASALAVGAVRELQHLSDGELQIALDRAIFQGADNITDFEWGATTIRTLRSVVEAREV